MLFLLRRLDSHPEVRSRLDAYCCAHLAPPAAQCAAAIDIALSRVFARAALGEPCQPNEIDQVKTALASYGHPSTSRKLAMFGWLLTTMLPQVRWEVPSAATILDSGEPLHSWIRAALCAARLADDLDNPVLSAGEQAALEATVRDTQGSDGGWEHHVLATLVVVLALHHARRASDVVECGLRYLLSVVNDDGGLPFIRDQDTFVTALAALTLSGSGATAGELAATVSYLVDAQRADDGWSYAEQVSQSDADTSSLVVQFLGRHPSAVAQRTARSGANYLLGLRGSDGGFPTFLPGAAPEAEITAKCIRAVLAAYPTAEQRPDLSASWAWLVARQHPDGGVPSDWCLSPAYSVMHLLEAAAHLRAARACRVQQTVVDRAVEFLRSHATPAGWALRPGAPAHPLSTAYAVAGLAAAGNTLHDRLLMQATRVVLRTTPDTPVAPDSLGPRPLVYDVPLLYPIYRLYALTAAHIHLSRA